MIDDINQLFGKQSRIDGVAYETGAGYRIIELKMSVVIPRQGSYPIAMLNP
jgi:hypothetical protein